jgi:hypothetical protein
MAWTATMAAMAGGAVFRALSFCMTLQETRMAKLAAIPAKFCFCQ